MNVTSGIQFLTDQPTSASIACRFGQKSGIVMAWPAVASQVSHLRPRSQAAQRATNVSSSARCSQPSTTAWGRFTPLSRAIPRVNHQAFGASG